MRPYIQIRIASQMRVRQKEVSPIRIAVDDHPNDVHAKKMVGDVWGQVLWQPPTAETRYDIFV